MILISDTVLLLFFPFLLNSSFQANLAHNKTPLTIKQLVL